MMLTASEIEISCGSLLTLESLLFFELPTQSCCILNRNNVAVNMKFLKDKNISVYIKNTVLFTILTHFQEQARCT